MPAGKKKASKNRGRPSESSVTVIYQHIRSIAPPKLIHTPSTSYYYTGEQLTHLTCSICYSILSQPVELGCDSLVCAACSQEWLEVSGDIFCPVCHHHQLDKATIKVPHNAVLEILAGLRVCCKICNGHTTAVHYDEHMKSKCTKHIINTRSVDDILCQSNRATTEEDANSVTVTF